MLGIWLNGFISYIDEYVVINIFHIYDYTEIIHEL